MKIEDRYHNSSILLKTIKKGLEINCTLHTRLQTTFVVKRTENYQPNNVFFSNTTYYQQQLHNPCDMNAKQINWRQFTVKLSKKQNCIKKQN